MQFPFAGVETSRWRCEGTVLWAAARLFGLYTAVAILFRALPAAKRGGASWPGKSAVRFSDALSAVRRWMWAEAVLPPTGGCHGHLETLRALARTVPLLSTLTPAA